MQYIKAYLFFLVFFLLFCCAKPLKERGLVIQDVFPKQKNTDSTFVFSLDTIKDLNHLESVICNEVRKCKQTFVRTSGLDVNLNFSSFFNCLGMICCTFRRNRIVTITNNYDSLYVGYKQNEGIFTVKNYQKLLSKQFLNRGKDYKYSSSPEGVVTHISIVDNYQDYNNIFLNKQRLINRLDTVSKAYYNFLVDFKRYDKIDSLKKVYPLNLSVPIPLPPSPPVNEVPPPPSKIESD